MKKLILLIAVLIGSLTVSKAQTVLSTITTTVTAGDVAASDYTMSGNSLVKALQRQFPYYFVFCFTGTQCEIEGYVYNYDVTAAAEVNEENLFSDHLSIYANGYTCTLTETDVLLP